MKKKIFVEGMCCKNCIKHVKKSLENIKDITKVKVNLKKAEVLVKAKTDVNDDLLGKAIEENGYHVIEIKDL